VGRRYAGWFIRNTEYAQRVLDGLKNTPLPAPGAGKAKNAGQQANAGAGGAQAAQPGSGAPHQVPTYAAAHAIVPAQMQAPAGHGGFPPLGGRAGGERRVQFAK
jgi:hypothetical protein